MRESRLIVLSVIYNLRDYLHTKGLSTDLSLEGFPYVRVTTKDQAYNEWVVPCIVIYPSRMFDAELQIGGGYWISQVMNFDIYGKTESQMLELADLVREFVESTSSVYRYDQKVPTYQVSDNSIRSIYEAGQPEEVCQMYFENRTVDFMDRVDTIGEARAHAAQLRTTITIPNS